MKHVLITGGNKGIGLETSRLFREKGYKVTVVAREVSNLPLTDVEGVAFDLTRVEGIPELVASLEPVDVLVNNAGVMYSLPYDAYPEEKMETMIKLNLQAPVALIRECAKAMAERGEGRIVNNASIAGQIGHPDVWYGITKAGLINATKIFAKLLGPKGVVVNAVAPGPVETDMLAVIPEERKAAIRKSVFTGRFAYAEEVARTIFWLGSESPVYINGTCVDLNNGAFPR